MAMGRLRACKAKQSLSLGQYGKVSAWDIPVKNSLSANKYWIMGNKLLQLVNYR